MPALEGMPCTKMQPFSSGPPEKRPNTPGKRPLRTFLQPFSSETPHIVLKGCKNVRSTSKSRSFCPLRKGGLLKSCKNVQWLEHAQR